MSMLQLILRAYNGRNVFIRQTDNGKQFFNPLNAFQDFPEGARYKLPTVESFNQRVDEGGDLRKNKTFIRDRVRDALRNILETVDGEKTCLMLTFSDDSTCEKCVYHSQLKLMVHPDARWLAECLTK